MINFGNTILSVISFIEQMFLEQLLYVRHCLSHQISVSEQSSQIPCPRGAYIPMGEDKINKTEYILKYGR